MASVYDRHVDLDTFMEGVKKRNPGQEEFVQAVQEVAQDVYSFIEDKEEYHEAQILRRIAEDRKSGAKGQSVYLGGRRYIKKKK